MAPQMNFVVLRNNPMTVVVFYVIFPDADILRAIYIIYNYGKYVCH
jgi:hypothetical protein